MPFTLPALPFARDALAPHMSAETIDFHYGKHHKAYVEKTNKLADAAGLSEKSLVEVIRAAKPGPLLNNSSQLWNHSFFWQCLSPNAPAPLGRLATLIESSYGSLDALVQAFSKEAVAHFGSGWAWLVLEDQALKVLTLHDGDSPVSHEGMMPLFALDVWEHAYYIDYRNGRAGYVAALLDNLVNWAFVAKNLDGNGISRADQG